jgi:phosphate transport system ATP-binding protein
MSKVQDAASSLSTENVSVWFGERQVLQDVSLTFPANKVTALIGPSGCGKSTFLRTLNRMHELIPSAGLAGSVLLDGQDIYDPKMNAVDVHQNRHGVSEAKPVSNHVYSRERYQRA